MALAPLFNCPMHSVVASFAAESVTVVCSQRINLAHSFPSSWDAKCAVFLTVGRRVFKIDQVFLKLVAFDCLYFSLKGS